MYYRKVKHMLKSKILPKGPGLSTAQNGEMTTPVANNTTQVLMTKTIQASQYNAGNKHRGKPRDISY